MAPVPTFSLLMTRMLACALVTLLAACSGDGTSRGPGDEGVDGTPPPNLPSNEGAVLRGSIGAGAGTVRDEAVAPDLFSIATLFAGAAGNTQSLAGAIDDRGLPTASAEAISDLAFMRPAVWPPASASDSQSLALPATIVDTSYTGAFDPSLAADQQWTRQWTVALDGSISRWGFFGRSLAPGTSLFNLSQPLANQSCPEGTTLKGRFSERFGALAADETALFFNMGGDYDVCQLPQRFTGARGTGGGAPRLTNDNVYELADALATFVGSGDADSSSLPNPPGVVLTVEPGTLIFGKSEQSLVVTRASRIEAAGLVSAPITFTSMQQLQARFDGDFTTPASGDDGGWGGLVLMGRAPNAGCGRAPCDIDAPFYGNHGGALADDRSGTLRYVLIRHGGGLEPGTLGVPSLRSLELLSAGRRTAIDYVQIHNGRDIGVVIDGGNAFLTHTVITDHRFIFSLSADSGWTGGLQHALVVPRTDSSAGIAIGSSEESPVTFPLIANITVLGSTMGAFESDQALRLDSGSRAQIRNSIFTGDFPGGCVDVDDEATFQRAFEAGGAPPDRPGPHLFFSNTVVDCAAVNFNENG